MAGFVLGAGHPSSVETLLREQPDLRWNDAVRIIAEDGREPVIAVAQAGPLRANRLNRVKAMTEMPNNVPPFAAISRLVDHVLLNGHTWAEWKAANDPLVKAAFVVETWLIANRMTPESQDVERVKKAKGLK